MATLDSISGAEPSTVTFKLRTVQLTQNSSAMQQEILTIGDPDSTNALAAVLNVVPASTAWGLAVRPVGNSSVVQGTSPWVISGASTVAPVTSSTWTTRPIQSSQGDLRMTAYQSTAADLNVTVAGYVAPSTTVNVSSLAGVVAIQGNSTVAQASTVWAVQLTQYSTIAAVSSVGGVVAVQQNSTTWAVQLANYSTIAAISSVGGVVTIAGNSTTFASVMSPLSSIAPSSGSSGLVVRQVVDAILTTGSTDAFGAGSTAFSVQSSGAALRSYVTAYSILTTNAGPTKVAFFTSGTMLWPIVLAAVSSAVTGANLAVGAPAYLFRTEAAEALTLRTKGSSIAGWHAGVSYFRAP